MFHGLLSQPRPQMLDLRWPATLPPGPCKETRLHLVFKKWLCKRGLDLSHVLCCREAPRGRAFPGPQIRSVPDPNALCDPARPWCGTRRWRGRSPCTHPGSTTRCEEDDLLLKLGGGTPGEGGKDGGTLWDLLPAPGDKAEAAGPRSPSGLCPRGGKPPRRKCLPHRAGLLQAGEASDKPSKPSLSGWLLLFREGSRAPADVLGKLWWGLGKWGVQSPTSS